MGTVLISLGIYWVHAAGSDAGYLVLAAALGYAKSRYVLDKTARRAAGRIIERGDGKCVGSFFSYKSWLLVMVMAGAGRVLRSGVISRLLLGFIYVTVGTGLVLSSRIFWQAYFKHAKKHSL